MIDHRIHRIAAFGKEVDGGAKQSLRAEPVEAWQDDEAGVNVLRGDQRAKIPRVLRYDNKVPFNASGKDRTVGRAQAAEVPRMHGEVCAFGIESLCNTRRQALIEKKAHGRTVAGNQAVLRQGRPEGRPRSGWAPA